MARAVWRGYITLGRVGIPVRLYSATQSGRPRFVQLHDRDGSPVERVLQCRAEHREIRIEDVVRAAETEPGHYVTITDQELDRAAPVATKMIDIKQFCEREAIDPVYYERPYYVVPGNGGERGYALVREALVRADKVALAQFVLHRREHIGGLAVYGDLVVLNQLRFASELISRSAIKTLPLPKSSPVELEALQAIVERFSGPLYLQDYHDEYGEYIQQLVDSKAKGLRMPRAERVAPYTTPEDELAGALRDTLGGSNSLR